MSLDLNLIQHSSNSQYLGVGGRCCSDVRILDFKGSFHIFKILRNSPFLTSCKAENGSHRVSRSVPPFEHLVGDLFARQVDGSAVAEVYP